MTTTLTLTLPENTAEDLEAVASQNVKPLGEYLTDHLTAHASEALHQAARRRACRRCSGCGQLHVGSGADETIPALDCVQCGRRMTAQADRFEPNGSDVEFFEIMAAGAPARIAANVEALASVRGGAA